MIGATEEVISKMKDVSKMNHRLVLLVGGPRSGKTRILKEIAMLINAPRVNVSLELGDRLLNLSKQERSQRVSEIFEDMLSLFRREDGTSFDTVLLDDIEILFEPSLRLNVLQLFQTESKNRTLVVGWPGRVSDDVLVYAEPGHAEYKKYDAEGLVVVEL